MVETGCIGDETWMQQYTENSKKESLILKHIQKELERTWSNDMLKTSVNGLFSFVECWYSTVKDIFILHLKDT